MNIQKPNPKVLQILNIVAFVMVVAVNALSNALPLNGRTAGEISDALPSYFTPAGYTFSIWGLIYLALLGFIIYQALPRQRSGQQNRPLPQQNRPLLQQIGWLFIASSVANVAWLFSWHYGVYVLSIFLMLALLGTLIAIYLRLNIGRVDPTLTLADRLLGQAPFSLYLGWITVATIANIASVAAHLGWDGFGIAEPTWAAIMIVVAAVVVGILLSNRRNLAYAGVPVWALLGIRAAQADVPLIANTTIIAAAFIVVMAAIGYARTRNMTASSRLQA